MRNKTTKPTPKLQLFCDGASGQYIPKRFATEVKRECLSGVDMADLDYLARGPGGCLDTDETLADGETERGEFYWETWETVCNNAIITDTNGQQYFLYQDGDLWLVPVEFEWNVKKECFQMPESMKNRNEN